MYRYYCSANPFDRKTIIPEQPFVTYIYPEPRYFPQIDRMAWGWVEYESPLAPAVIAKFKLIAAPREDE